VPPVLWGGVQQRSIGGAYRRLPKEEARRCLRSRPYSLRCSPSWSRCRPAAACAPDARWAGGRAPGRSDVDEPLRLARDTQLCSAPGCTPSSSAPPESASRSPSRSVPPPRGTQCHTHASWTYDPQLSLSHGTSYARHGPTSSRHTSLTCNFAAPPAL